MNESRKYCRSLHAQISLGTTSDDRFMPDGYVGAFSDLDLVLTEKLDGQNNCFNKYGVFARSHTSTSQHPWDKPMRERWELIKNDLNDLEIFGENMYGIHSIEYTKLESYYYVFAVREHDTWLSWEEVQFYANLLDFPVVPEIEISKSLKTFIENSRSENEALEKWLEHNLGMSWLAYTKTSGKLGGLEPNGTTATCEGFVIRNAQSFQTNTGMLPVAKNEFDNLCKLVRPSHVQTDVHWTKTWRPATLNDYNKYGWHAYQYLDTK
ncbi:MAG: RNA ligase family protein [Flavobacteriales bacterium]|nr:RNA ligase family protein [Flavobacteriales bacterium]